MRKGFGWRLATWGGVCILPIVALGQFSGGSGTLASPYLISSAADLNAIRNAYLGTLGTPIYYRQTADIDLSAYPNPDPIGTDSSPAYVVYDGGSHRISGLSITRPLQNYIGLFGVLNGTLKNLELRSSTISASQRAGGFAGMLLGGSIENCRSEAVVSGSLYVGGLVGLVQQGTIVNSCQRGGSVSASTASAGGICGYLNVAGTVASCYAASGVSASNQAGGLVGFAGGATVSSSYWDTSVTGQSTSSGGGTGLSTAAMMQRASFSGWDFSSTWQLYETQSYPYLQQFAKQTQTPVLDPSGGTYVGATVAVTATCASAGARVHYTTNSAAPSGTSASVASGGQVAVPLPGTLKAVAWVAYENPSVVVTVTYDAAPSVETPELAPPAGSYPGARVAVTVTCATAGATLRYTLDGSDPDDGTLATVASGGTVDVALTNPPVALTVRAFRSDMNPSESISAIYTTVASVGAPVLAPAGGTFAGDSLSVTVTCNTAGADIWVTTNGSPPAVSNGIQLASGDAVLVPLTAATNVLLARAFRIDLNDSVITTGRYVRAAVADMPVLDPPGGTSTSSQILVALNSATPGAVIRYTLNGVDPDGASAAVTNGGSITVPVVQGGTTVKARAYHAERNPSTVATGFYEPAPAVETPVFTPVDGQPTGTVQITCATAGATIRYTTNGLPPAVDSQVVTNGAVVTVPVPGALKARAWKVGLFVSAINTAYYGEFAGGDGTPADPYRIASVEHLNNVRTNLSSSFVLIEDLNLGVAPWDSGSGWLPIGSFATPFLGTMDGAGHVISNLYINRFGTEDIGLFGYLGMSGVIHDLGVKDSDVTGMNYVGGLVGYSEGHIERCFTTGQVLGNIMSLSGGAGGLVGRASANAWINTSYADTAVLGAQNLGGLVGHSQSDILNCYSAGQVDNVSNAGGLLGYYISGSVSGCYWDTETSQRPTSAGGAGVVGKNTAEMLTQTTFSGWDFSGVWRMPGAAPGYPVLQAFDQGAAIPPPEWVIQFYGSVDDAPNFSVKGRLLSSEYIAGTDPTDYRSMFVISPIEGTVGSMTLHVNSVTGRFYTVEGREDLGNGSWQLLGSVPEQPGTGGPLAFDLPYSSTSGFYRVGIRLDN